jgi:D-alanine-D-alanine ligase-like ATP-grasp enzyme
MSHQELPKIKCSACGTSPVNHRLFRAMSVLDDVLQKTMGLLFGWVPVPREGVISNAINAGLVGFFRLLGLAHFSDDRTKAASGRSELIWEEAHRRGIKMQQIVMFGRYLEQYRARIGNHWVYFQSIPIPPWLPQKGYEWLDDKFKLSHVLEKSGVPAPKARSVSSFRAAKRAFQELQKPVIIKPRSGSRGRHTTTNINTIEELRYAYDLARQIALELVVEEHLFGPVHRATVVNNKLSGFFQAKPPCVTGDGIHTVQELIDIQNANRPEKINAIQVGDDTIEFIKRFGYTLESVLPQGTALDLTAKTGRFFGGYTKELFTEVHPKMHEYFQKAGEAVQASIVGFDVIIQDPTADPDTQKWGIIECNSLPFIDLHYYAYEGTPVDIAKNIWDVWEEKYLIHQK